VKLQFFGATGFVTGSCHLLSFEEYKILLDCGMFQGREGKKSHQDFAFNPKDIDAVLLSHAHLDHSGLLPKLVKKGFSGNIYCTTPTKDLAKVVMEDSGKIQEFETKWDNKRLRKEGKPLRKPLYTVKDAKKTIPFLKGVEYNQMINPLPGLNVVFRNAGHILGSAIIEVFAEGKKLVFSGDLGQMHAPIIDDPSFIEKADYVICESTYGGRNHETKTKKRQLLTKAVRDAEKNKGKLIIPCFAIERSQEIIYYLNELIEKKKVPCIPMFVDSPMSMKATEVFIDHTENYDEEARDMLARGDKPFEFDCLKFIKSSEDSKSLNDLQGPAVIIASSGMCSGGRIKHHLLHHLSKKSTIMLFVGFQAYGTLGRRILEGQKKVRIYGWRVRNNADIRRVDGFSSHADQTQLLKWIHGFKTKPQLIFVHGETDQAEALKKKVGRGHVAKLYEEVEL